MNNEQSTGNKHSPDSEQSSDNKQSSDNGGSDSGGKEKICCLTGILRDPVTYRRLVLLAIILALILVGMTYLARKILLDNFPPIRLETNGIVIEGTGGSPKQAAFPLHASDLWARTNLEVKKGQKLDISVSGRVNLASHRVMLSGMFDTKADVGWVTWPGSYEGKRPLDVEDRDLRLVPEAGFGSLLAHVCCEGVQCPDDSNPQSLRQLKNKRNEVIQVVIDSDTKKNQGTLPVRCDGILYFTVNENVPLERKQYVKKFGNYVKRVKRELENGKATEGQLFLNNIVEWGMDTWAKFASKGDEDIQIEKILDVPERDKKGACKQNNSDCVCQTGDWKELRNLVYQKCIEKSDDSANSGHGIEDLSNVYRGNPTLFVEDVFEIFGQYPWHDDEYDYRGNTNSKYKVKIRDEKCLAALMCARDSMRWENTIKIYPRIFYDENFGSFWLTIGF